MLRKRREKNETKTHPALTIPKANFKLTVYNTVRGCCSCVNLRDQLYVQIFHIVRSQIGSIQNPFPEYAKNESLDGQPVIRSLWTSYLFSLAVKVPNRCYPQQTRRCYLHQFFLSHHSHAFECTGYHSSNDEAATENPKQHSCSIFGRKRFSGWRTRAAILRGDRNELHPRSRTVLYFRYSIMGIIAMGICLVSLGHLVLISVEGYIFIKLPLRYDDVVTEKISICRRTDDLGCFSSWDHCGYLSGLHKHWIRLIFIAIQNS